jgi:hypothetical protein
VTKQRLNLEYRLFSRTISQAKMRNSTMQPLDQREMTRVSHRTSSRARPEPEDHRQEDEMAKTHLEDRKSYVHKPKDKTNFGEVLVPDDKDQQIPRRRLSTADSTHLQAGKHETCHVAGYNTMHVDMDTKYEFTFKKAVQQTAPLDTIFPTMRRDPDSMTQQQTHIKE